MHGFHNSKIPLEDHRSLPHSYLVDLSIIQQVPTTNKGHWVSLLVNGLGLPAIFLLSILRGMSLERLFYKGKQICIATSGDFETSDFYFKIYG